MRKIFLLILLLITTASTLFAENRDALTDLESFSQRLEQALINDDEANVRKYSCQIAELIVNGRTVADNDPVYDGVPLGYKDEDTQNIIPLEYGFREAKPGEEERLKKVLGVLAVSGHVFGYGLESVQELSRESLLDITGHRAKAKELYEAMKSNTDNMTLKTLFDTSDSQSKYPYAQSAYKGSIHVGWKDPLNKLGLMSIKAIQKHHPWVVEVNGLNEEKPASAAYFESVLPELENFAVMFKKKLVTDYHVSIGKPPKSYDLIVKALESKDFPYNLPFLIPQVLKEVYTGDEWAYQLLNELKKIALEKNIEFILQNRKDIPKEFQEATWEEVGILNKLARRMQSIIEDIKYSAGSKGVNLKKYDKVLSLLEKEGLSTPTLVPLLPLLIDLIYRYDVFSLFYELKEMSQIKLFKEGIERVLTTNKEIPTDLQGKSWEEAYEYYYVKQTIDELKEQVKNERFKGTEHEAMIQNLKKNQDLTKDRVVQLAPFLFKGAYNDKDTAAESILRNLSRVAFFRTVLETVLATNQDIPNILQKMTWDEAAAALLENRVMYRL